MACSLADSAVVTQACRSLPPTNYNHYMRRQLITYLPEWTREWLEIIVPGLQILLILLVALLLQYSLRRIVNRASLHYQLPRELTVPLKGFIRWTIMAAAVLLALERMGVSATVLWTAFTGFATVGAVAFFAAWSVLSNLFCAFLIFTARPFRIGDTIEVLDTAEKQGARGTVIDINLLYTTLEDSTIDHAGTLLQIPNALIFQRVVRRWKGGQPPPAPTESAELAEDRSAVHGGPGAVGQQVAAIPLSKP